MKEFVFEGYSDDTFGELTTGEDYDNCASGKPIEFLVNEPGTDEKLVVVGQYCPGSASGWLIGVSRYSADDNCDDEALPFWPIRIEPSRNTPYTPSLIIEVPDSAQVVCLTGGGM